MNPDDNAELIIQQKSISKALALIFIPIFLIIVGLTLIRNNSLSFLEKKYRSIHNSYYSGKITNLFLETNSGAQRTIRIDNTWNKEIPFFIYNELNIGDSLFKIAESDFEYYIKTANNDTIIWDVNKFYRTKYLNKLNKK
ncbi:hypothetical protein [Winogradskyella sediminis]|uniref:Uncharacterized protein n=1 Tax=Winogradskyella sediminis TaxID=1382466 RepID=A0A1H1LV09_9FLAO|nr:hypothetical protein [Winogradskyella sediminis]REG86055.1 hypothetical protein C8N41_103151 [Winogradskyella sediminis]SDR78366.1 hypothetical protein SAMN04489797_0111 [Winogradskyella sediminis]